MDLVDLLHPNGVENPGGLATLHGFSQVDDFLLIQKTKELTDPDATPENVSQIDNAHIWKPGKCMTKLYCTQKKGSLKSAVVGDFDGIGKKSTVAIFFPGLAAKTLGLSRLVENSNGIFFTQMSDSQIVQLGSERFPAKAKCDFDAADNEGVRGTMINFETYERLIIYTPGLNFVPAAGGAPAITTQPHTQSVPVGGSAALSVVATNAAAFTWYKNGVPMNEHKAYLLLLNVQAANAATYAVQITGNDGTKLMSADAVITLA
jgi:hypothetical protein